MSETQPVRSSDRRERGGYAGRRGGIPEAEKKVVPPEERKTPRQMLETRRYFRDQATRRLNAAIKDGFNGEYQSNEFLYPEEKEDGENTYLKIEKTVTPEIETQVLQGTDGKVNYSDLYKLIKNDKPNSDSEKEEMTEMLQYIFYNGDY